MKFSLLENGIDSLRQASINIDGNYLDYEFESFQLKDGLFNFVHGVEILAKYLISNHDEEAVIKHDSKQKYRMAKSQLDEHHKSVFEVIPDLNTISARDSIKLLKREFNMSNDLSNDVLELINTRDSLMHYTVEMNGKKKNEFVKKLRASIDITFSYFNEQIPNFDSVFKKLERNYPYTRYDEWEDKAIAAAEASYEDGKLGI